MLQINETKVLKKPLSLKVLEDKEKYYEEILSELRCDKNNPEILCDQFVNISQRSIAKLETHQINGLRLIKSTICSFADSLVCIRSKILSKINMKCTRLSKQYTFEQVIQ